MEAQIDTLEVRLFRREKELMGAVEEAKTAATIERSRLEALHAQVLICLSSRVMFLPVDTNQICLCRRFVRRTINWCISNRNSCNLCPR